MRALIVVGLLWALPSFALAEERPWNATKWYVAHQKLGVKFGRGGTATENKVLREQLLAELGKLDGVAVELKTKVSNIRWKDGIAEVTTLPFIPQPGPGTPQPPIKMGRSAPIEVRMEEVEAAMIKQGDWLTFAGTMRFQVGRWGAVGRTIGAQQMYSLTHGQLGGGYLGTYTSADCVITIGGKTYASRWASE